MPILIHAIGCRNVVGAMSQHVRYVESNPTSWLQVDKAAYKSKVVIIDSAS